MTSPGRRLFIGVMPGPAEQARTAACAAQWRWPAGARRVPADALHLTLHFLGQVSAADEAALTQQLGRVAFAPLQITWDGAQLWPAGVAVLRPRDEAGCARLRALHAELAAALVRAGLAPETRAWTPHVTLARHARGATPVVPAPPLVWPVARFSLVWSRPDAPPPRYQVLQSWPAP